MSPPVASLPDAPRPRRRLFWKYVVVIVALVTTLLVASGAVEMWFSYQESRDALVVLQREKAAAAAGRIEAFIREIERQMGWTTLPLLASGSAALEQRRIDFVRLQRQVQPITDLQYLDSEGKEQLRVSRLAMDVVGSGIDFSADPRFRQAIARKVYHGPVTFRKESEPYMVVAMAQSGGGVTVAEVNLKFIWDVVTQIKIGKAGRAYVVDEAGNLIAHPDISLVLQKTSLSALPQVREALAGGGRATPTALDVQGRRVLTAHATIPGLRWAVFAEQPLEEALAPLESSLKRSLVLIAIGVSLAIGASLALARRMVRPIQALQAGAARIGGGELGYRIEVRTRDELQALAAEFNRMTATLQESYATLEQRVVERTQELTESLEQQTATGEILKVIASSLTDTQPVFDAIAVSAAKLCSVDDVFIVQVENDVLRAVSATGQLASASPDYNARNVPVSRDSVAGRAIVDRTTLHIADLAALSEDEFPEGRALQRLFGHRTMLATPLLREGTAVGAIVVFRFEVRPFSERQIALLQTFADQAVIAIENVRLFTELESRNAALTESLEQQTATGEILRVISSSPTDTQPVFDTIIRNAVRLSGAAWGFVTRVEAGLIHPVAHHNLDAEQLERFRGLWPRPVEDRSPTAHVVRSGQLFRAVDVQAEDFGLTPEALAGFRARGVRSIVVVPMFRHGEVIGTINLTHQAVGAFSDAHVALIRTFADQAVIAIENVRLFTELESKNATLTETLEQQTATSEVLGVISESPTDVLPVFAAILRNGLRLSGAHYGAVFRFEEGVFRLALATDVRPELEHHIRTFGIPAGRETPLAQVGLDLRPVTTADIQNDPRFSPPEAHRREGMRSVLSVPMLREGRLVGALTFHTREVRPFTDKQVEVVSTFARQAVIAIENVRLFKELESRNSELSESLEQQTATAEILRVISSSPTDIQPVLDAVAGSATKVCGATDALIMRVEGQDMRRVAHVGPIPLVLPEVRRITSGSSAGRAIVECQPIHVHDILGPDAARDYPEAAGAGWRTTLSVPLMREGVAIGAITIRRTEVRPFTDKQIALLQTFADQAVIAIENVRLFKELEARNAEVTESLEQQTATAEILRVINAAQVDLQPVFEAIAASAARLCEGLTGSVFLVEDGQVRPAARHNFPTEAFEDVFPAPLDSDLLTARAIAERGVAHSPDILLESDYRHREFAERLGFRSLLSVPMMREGSPIGAITVTRAQAGRFSDKQIALLQTFADQAVIALENVRLLTELQQRNAEVTEALEQQTATAEILRVISSSPTDMQPVLDAVAQSAVRLGEAHVAVLWLASGNTLTAAGLSSDHTGIARGAQMPVTALLPSGRAVLEGVTTQVDDVVPMLGPVDEAFPEAGAAMRRNGVRAILATPLLREGRAVGALVVGRREVRGFDEKYVNLLKTFADQAVIAIENVRLFTELQERTSQLQVANRHKDEFLANMSHELRTPLNAIIGFSEVMLERMFGELNDKQDEYLNDILSSGRHLLSLINDILDLSKIEAGRMELELTDFNLPVAIDNALTLVHERAARRGLTVSQDVDERLGEFRGDERKIKQVLLNLLSNAIKFTPEGGKVEVRAHRKGAVVEIAVADTGVGIAPADQELVFEEFRQVGTDVAKKHEGTGLGLALARRIVELHGGNLWLESEVGVGSTFTFELPVRR